MASSVVNNPSPSAISQLLNKLNDVDPDLRFMSLNDLNQILTGQKSDFLRTDYNTSSKIADSVIRALDDQNGEVQNLAVKWSVRISITPSPLPLRPIAYILVSFWSHSGLTNTDITFFSSFSTEIA